MKGREDDRFCCQMRLELTVENKRLRADVERLKDELENLVLVTWR